MSRKMACRGSDSTNLIKAVLEQADEVEYLGGFDSNKDCDQFLRDARTAVRKLSAAEKILEKHFLKTEYKDAIKRTAAHARAEEGK